MRRRRYRRSLLIETPLPLVRRRQRLSRRAVRLQRLQRRLKKSAGVAVLVVSVALAAAFFNGDFDGLLNGDGTWRLTAEGAAERVAEAAMASGNLPQAVTTLRHALVDDPQRSSARWLLAKAYLALGAGKAAEEELKQLQALGGDTPAALPVALARAQLLQGKFHQALARIQKSVGASGDPEARVVEGLALAGLDRLDAASAAFHTALGGNPANVEARHGLAQIAAASGDIAGARAQLEHLGPTPATDAAASILKAEIALAAHEFAAARELFTRALTTGGDTHRARVGMAHTLLRLEQPREAQVHIDLAASRYPQSPLVNYLKAVSAGQQGDIDTAVSALRAALRAAPQHRASLLLLASLHYHSRDLNQADALLERYLAATEGADVAASSADPATFEARMLYAKVKLATHQAPAAVDALKILTRRHPASIAAHLALAQTHRQSDEPHRARQAFEAVLRLDPAHLVASVALASMDLAAGNRTAVLATAHRLHSSHPKSPAGFMLEGDLLMSENRALDAVVAYEAASSRVRDVTVVLKLFAARRLAGQSIAAYSGLKAWLADYPHDVHTRLVLASALEGDGEIPGAAQHYERVLEQRPDDPIALNNLAVIYHELDDARALALAAKAYKQSPNQLEVLDSYGWILLQSGQVEQGMALLDKAIAQAPHNLMVQQHHHKGLEQLSRIQRPRPDNSASGT